jgi:hypothetical protein
MHPYIMSLLAAEHVNDLQEQATAAGGAPPGPPPPPGPAPRARRARRGLASARSGGGRTTRSDLTTAA